MGDGKSKQGINTAVTMLHREGGRGKSERWGDKGRGEGGMEITFIVISVSLVVEPSEFTDCNRTCSRELEQGEREIDIMSLVKLE